MATKRNRVCDHFDLLASSGDLSDQEVSNHSNSMNTNMHIQLLLPQLLDQTPSPNQRSLDVGIGTGTTSEAFTDEFTITGLDYSDAIMQIARRKLISDDLHQIDLETPNVRLPFDDNTFGVVYSADTLLCLRNAPQVISEMNRVCAPNGIVIFSVHVHKSNEPTRL